MTFRAEPLGVIGASIDNADLTCLNAEDALELKNLLNEHLVLFFRNQSLTPRSLHELAAKLGTPVPYPHVKGLADFPEIIEVTKQPEDTVNFGGVWHSDTAYLERPAMGALLYGVNIPSSGGDTIFTNMYRVYDDLSPGMQAFLGNLHGINDADKAAISATRGVTGKRGLTAIHPVVRTHPESGRKLLYVNRAHTTRFSEMTEHESRPILEYLFSRIEDPAYSYRFQWQPNSLAFWDNRACQHFPVNDYDGSFRKMLRVSLDGDKPV